MIMQRFLLISWTLAALISPLEAGLITLSGTVRDFHRGDQPGGHPDFERFTAFSADLGIVEPVIGGDGKPIYNGSPTTPTTTGEDNFNQWYRNVPGVNQSAVHQITLSDAGHPGVFTYASEAFFPIDNQLFGNEGLSHNYHFTYELHNTFTYVPGQTFTFTGDDDLWVFINGRLAIDLGGVHPRLTSTIDLAALAGVLGIIPGNQYTFDLFFAERRTVESRFRIDTSIVLEPASVPEPGTMTLAGLGIVGWIGSRWRKRRMRG